MQPRLQRVPRLHPCFTVEVLRSTSATITMSITRILIHEGRSGVVVLIQGINSVKESPRLYVPPNEAVRSMHPVDDAPSAL